MAGVAVEYAWGGQVAFTLDQMPHAGRLDGVHYALGYGGTPWFLPLVRAYYRMRDWVGR